jgi:ABC-2 type transport system permease protein
MRPECAALRAVGAVARRELRVWARYPGWIVSLVVWPLLFPLLYLFGSRAFAGPGGEGMAAFTAAAGTDNVAGFIVVGTAAWMWLNITLWGVGTSLRADQVRGVLESNWLTPAPRFPLLLGTAASQAVIAAAFLALSLIEFRLVLGVRFQASAAGTLAVLVLTIPWLYGLGMAFAAVVLRFKEANALVYLVRGLFMVFAGITFPLAALPAWMRAVAAALPLTYTIDGLRRALLTGAGPGALREALLVLAASGAICGLLGYALFQAVDRHLRRAGSLAQH